MLMEREPEREPDLNYMDGNITHSIIDNEQTVRGALSSGIPGSKSIQHIYANAKKGAASSNQPIKDNAR